jgi:hypothetical protein
VSKGGVAAANGAIGASSVAAIGPIAAMGASLWAAMLPVLPIVLAIVAAIAAAVAIFAIFSAVAAADSERIKKATQATTVAIKSNVGAVKNQATAQLEWDQALTASTSSYKDSIKNIKDLGKNLEANNQITSTSTALQDEAVKTDRIWVQGLADAKLGLRDLQATYRNHLIQGRVTHDQAIGEIRDNKDLQATLIRKAKAMGDNIELADGSIDMEKALAYATGEGAYQTQKAINAQKKFGETMKSAIATFIDFKGPLQQNSDDIKKYGDAVKDSTGKATFSLTKYKEDIGKQAKGLTDWMTNIKKLRGVMTDAAGRKQWESLVAMGKDGADLVASLAKGTEAQMKAQVSQYQGAATVAQDAKAAAQTYSRAYSDTAAITSLITKTADKTKLQDMISKGNTVFDIATAFNISEDSLLAAQKKLDVGLDVEKNIDLSASWKTGTLDSLKTAATNAVGSFQFVMKVEKADGGLVGAVRRAAGGVVRKFEWGGSYNGKVSGPGGPREDRIPAMISNGEFVVNARDTAKNYEALQRINNGGSAAGMGGNQIGITINAAPGMDERQVADLVTYQLNTQLAKGASI